MCPVPTGQATAPTTPLKQALRDKGYGAQADLARFLKCGETQVSKYANGLVPGPSRRKKIAGWLGIEENELWPTT